MNQILDRVNPTDPYQTSAIQGVLWRPLQIFHDRCGWLCELSRQDELLREYHPELVCVSVTEPGVARGPHEHRQQANLFCFVGPSNFKLYLTDNRPNSPTYMVSEVDTVGVDRPMGVIIPPGVVLAYRNVGQGPGVVFNRLYKGPGRQEPVVEIRHGHDSTSPIRLGGETNHSGFGNYPLGEANEISRRYPCRWEGFAAAGGVD